MLMLVDGHGLAYRAYYGLQRTGLKTREGLPTFAVYGFLKLLLDAVIKYKPDKIAIAFDKAKKTFRNDLYPEYKAHRKPMPDDMKEQLSIIWDVIHAFGIPVYQKEGFEADDIIGTMATKFSEEEPVIILSGDRDLLQLVKENVRILLPKPSATNFSTYGEDEVLKDYNFKPYQIVHYKALAGDSSDNIPGAPGIGDKTAKNLIDQFGTIDNIISSAEQIVSQKVKNSIINNEELIRLSYKLALIDINVPLEIQDPRPADFDKDKLIEILTKLEFTSILRELPLIVPMFVSEQKCTAPEPCAPPLNYKVVENLDELKKIVERIRELGYFAVDLETTGVKALQVDLVGIAIAYEKLSFYVPLMHDNLLELDRNLPLKETLEIMKPVLEDINIPKIAHNIKYEINVLSRYGIKLRGIKDDTFIEDYVLNPTANHGLKDIAFTYFGYNMTPITELIGSGAKAITMCQVPVETAAPYACADAAVTLKLSEYLGPKIKECNMDDLYRNIELALIPVLAHMEQNGIKVDCDYLKAFSKKLSDELNILEGKIYELTGQNFNINSPKQLGAILFDNLKLSPKGIKKTVHGYSTDSPSLEKLKSSHAVVSHLLEYRQLIKLKTTYIDSLPVIMNPHTGRIHTSFNQTITATGRLSSSDPNLQNIPIKTEIGSEIRRAFVPERDDAFIVTADYSQIELRVLAHFSEDPTFLNAFANYQDIHTITASTIFKIPLNEVTKAQRSMAKTVNFGIIYGQTPFGLSSTLGVPMHEAKRIIDEFNQSYEGIKIYFDKLVQDARDNGYVTTILNRRRYLPDINNADRTRREFAERTAINTPIQGSAADIIKVAMIELDKKLKENNFKAQMLLQVHDELVLEVPKEELDSIIGLVQKVMEHAVELKVPLLVDVNYGRSWKDAK